MSFFAVSLKSNLRRLLKPSAFFPALLLAVSLLIGGYVQKELIIQPAVGVFFEASSDITMEIIRNIESFSNVRIRQYDDMDEMLEDIASVELECGYVFNKDIDKYLETGAINRAAKLYKSPATVADGFINEVMFAALFKTSAPYMAANYLNGKIEGSYAEVLAEAKEVTKSYYDTGIFLNIDTTDVGSSAEIKPERRINTGVISVYLFIMLLYVTIGGIGEKKTGLYEKLGERDGAIFLISFISAHAILLFVTSAALAAPIYGTVRSIAIIGAYIFMLVIISAIAALFIKSTHMLYALFPIVCVIVITLGGAFFDISDINPALGKISRIFPTYYFCIYM